MPLPFNHAQRFILNDEVHARPPEALAAPLRIAYLALYANWPARDADLDPVRNLAVAYGAAIPMPGANHYSADFGPFRLKWERHGEFMRYKFIAPGVPSADPFGETAIALIPPDWLAALPGETMVAAHSVLLPGAAANADYADISRRLFGGGVVIGSKIAGGAGEAFTDFHIHADGFSRWLVHDFSMTQRQAGRLIQRLMEIDTYRMLALLTFPVARELAPFLGASEQELARITAAMTNAGEADEPELLDRLTRLEAAIENRHAGNHARFSAAAAYYDLVRRRTEELREVRIEGLQTVEEFMERRLAPAMSTCSSAAARQQALSERVSRATQLLSTRVGISRERQSQALLESMDRRAKLQLRLQQTVEGLSVAAITYYIVGLAGYGAKGLQSFGLNVNPDIAMAVSIPVAGLLVWLGIRRVRQSATRDG